VTEIGHTSVQALSGGRDASIRGRLAAIHTWRYTRGVRRAVDEATEAGDVPLVPRFKLLETLRRKQTASLLMHAAPGRTGAAPGARIERPGRVRVLVDAANLKPGQGGIRTYTIGLITALARDPRLAVTVAASVPEVGGIDGVDLVALEPSTRSVVGRALWRERRLPMLVRSTRADVLVAPVPELPFRRLDVPALVVVHDVGPLVAPAFYTANKRLRYVATLRHACRRAATIVCVSHSTLVGLRGAVGADVARCVVIGEGPQELPPAEAGAAGLRGEPFVLYVGSLDARKNVETLVAAVTRAEPPLPLRLVIVGPSEDGEVAGVVPSQARERVEHRGFVEPAELASLYRTCTAVALPSLYEGFGLPVLEAFVAGAPVVVSDIPPAREVAGDAALYVSRPLDRRCWEDALRSIATDDELRRRLLDGGAAAAAAHTWAAVGASFADAILASVGAPAVRGDGTSRAAVTGAASGGD
jgi:glycosyltransferase involved in cell wall biosynthesis